MREDIHRAISRYLANVHLIIMSILFFYCISLRSQVKYDTIPNSLSVIPQHHVILTLRMR